MFVYVAIFLLMLVVYRIEKKLPEMRKEVEARKNELAGRSLIRKEAAMPLLFYAVLKAMVKQKTVAFQGNRCIISLHCVYAIESCRVGPLSGSSAS